MSKPVSTGVPASFADVKAKLDDIVAVKEAASLPPQQAAEFFTEKQLALMVVHLKRERYDVRIDRNSKWGNPFFIGADGTREEVIAKYEKYLLGNPELLSQIGELRGKVLGCWCAPKACHGDVLVRIANTGEVNHVSD